MSIASMVGQISTVTLDDLDYDYLEVEDAEAVATDAEAVATDAEAVATDAEAVATDAEAVATDAEAVATDAEAVATDAEAVATDAEAVATDAEDKKATYLQQVANFIPSETTALYLLALNFFPVITTDLPRINELVFWIAGIIITAVYVLLSHWATYEIKGGNWINRIWRRTKNAAWPLFASTTAFALWALNFSIRPFSPTQGMSFLIVLCTGIYAFLLPTISEGLSRRGYIEYNPNMK